MVGRSRAAHLVLDGRRVSGEHAALHWTGGAWELRDLGSRNGTFAGSRRLTAGERHPLGEGEELGFGTDEDPWVLVSGSAPAALATCGDAWVEGEEGLLGLPDLDSPALLIVQDDQGAWWFGEDEHRKARDLEELRVDGRTWTLHLPEILLPTLEARAVLLDELRLDFAVSSDEEYIELTAHLGGESHKLPSRAHHEALLALARHRLEDAGAGGSPAEHGWVYSDALQKELRWSSNQLYVGIHRARKELESRGLLDASALIERRTTTRQLRLGVSALQVRSL